MDKCDRIQTLSRLLLYKFFFFFLFIMCARSFLSSLSSEVMSVPFKYRIYNVVFFLIVPRDARVWSQIITVLSINLKMLLIITTIRFAYIDSHSGYIWRSSFCLSMCWLYWDDCIYYCYLECRTAIAWRGLARSTCLCVVVVFFLS